MSRPVKIVCDGCGRQKEQANRWWVVAVGEHPELNCPVMIVSPLAHPLWEPENHLKVYDFCGETCALKFISEQMGKHGEETA